MTVHTLDAQHNLDADPASPAREQATGGLGEGRRLRVSFAANAHSGPVFLKFNG